MYREPLPADASLCSPVSQKSSQKSKTQSKAQPKRPPLTTTTRPLTTSTGNNPQAVSDNRNVSPLSSFERFLFIMIVVALLLVLAHLLSWCADITFSYFIFAVLYMIFVISDQQSAMCFCCISTINHSKWTMKPQFFILFSLYSWISVHSMSDSYKMHVLYKSDIFYPAFCV